MGCTNDSISRWESPVCELLFGDVDTNFIEKIRVTFAQGRDENGKKRIVFEKTEKDFKFEGNRASFALTQEETLSLDPNEYLILQIQIYDKNGTPYVSDEGLVGVNDVINEGVSW